MTARKLSGRIATPAESQRAWAEVTAFVRATHGLNLPAAARYVRDNPPSALCIAALPHFWSDAVAQLEKARAADQAAVNGRMGGRRPTRGKPSGDDLRRAFELQQGIDGGGYAEARTNLVEALCQTHRITAPTARAWLTAAGIPSRRK